MKSVIDCPRCNGRVTAPAGMFEHTLVRCPHCKTEYEFKEALQYAPPELEVIGITAAPPELKFDESMFGDGEFNLAPDYAKSESPHEEAPPKATGLAFDDEVSEAAVFKISADDLDPIEDAPLTSADAEVAPETFAETAPATNEDVSLDDMWNTDEPATSSAESSHSTPIDLEETVAFGFEDDQPAEENPPEVEAAIESVLTGEPVGVPDDEAFDFLGDDAPANGKASFHDEPVAMRMDADTDDMFAPVSNDNTGYKNENTDMEMMEDIAAEAESTQPVVAPGKKEKGAKAVVPVGGVPGIPSKPKKKKRSLISTILGVLVGFPVGLAIVYGALMWGLAMDPLEIAGVLPQAIVPPSLRMKDTTLAKVPVPNPQPDSSEDDEPAKEGEPTKNPVESNPEIKSRSERMKEEEEAKKAAANADPSAPAAPLAPAIEIPGAAPTDPAKATPPAAEPGKAAPMTETPKEEKPSIENPLDKPITVEPMIPIGNDPFTKPETQPKAEPAPMPTTPADPLAPAPATPADKAPDTTKPVEPLNPAEPMKTPDPAPAVDPFATPAPMPMGEPTKPAEPAPTPPPSEPMKEATPMEPAKPADVAKIPETTPADPFATPAPTPMPEPAKPVTPEVKIVTLTGEKKFSESDLAAVVKKVKELPDYTVETDATKKGAGKMMTYRSLAELGETTSFVNSSEAPAKVDEQLKAATALLKDVMSNDAKMTELGGLSQAWTNAKSRTSNGIFVSGQVQQSTAQGKLFVSQVEVPGQTPVVIEVISTSELKKGPVALIGSIVDKPTTTIPTFEGTDHRVIWASATAGQ